jgi:hypothetical protein
MSVSQTKDFVRYADDAEDFENDPRYILAKRLREEGETVKNTCFLCSISMSTYYHWFKESVNRPVREAQLQQIAEMRQMRNLGETDAAIARYFKTSRQRVHVLLGPRGNRRSTSLKLTWTTNPNYLHEVEKVCRRCGAISNLNDNGDGPKPSFQKLLDMIARGELMVTAAPSKIRPTFPAAVEAMITEDE